MLYLGMSDAACTVMPVVAAYPTKGKVHILAVLSLSILILSVI